MACPGTPEASSGSLTLWLEVLACTRQVASDHRRRITVQAVGAASNAPHSRRVAGLSMISTVASANEMKAARELKDSYKLMLVADCLA